MLTFDSSYSYDRVSFKISSTDLLIQRVPVCIKKNMLMVIVYSEDDREIQREFLNVEENNRITLVNVPDAKYYLNLFVNSGATRAGSYYSYFQSRSISLQVVGGKWHFIVAPIINTNREVLAKLKTDASALKYYTRTNEYLIESGDPQIQKLAKEITQFKVTPMQKITAVHDWVADNIYYDFDAIEDGSHVKHSYSALEVLKTKRCVCRGYVNLGVALIRALGIPALVQECYSLNIDTDGGWDRPENQVARSNHVIILAYVEDRWTIMDITWDSFNKYRNGKFEKEKIGHISRRYFNATLEMISNTHKFK